MKKLISVFLICALILSVSMMTACNKATTQTEETAVEEPAAETTGELTPIVVGASSTPHAEILEQVKDTLKEQGYDLQIVVYDDYVLPNQALTSGDLDANYFQHSPYLNSYNESNGTDIQAAALIHYEPFGLYGQGITDYAESNGTIIIPADDSNETRALLLLQQEGLITLPEDKNASTGVTVLDVVDSNGYTITPVDASTVAAQYANSETGTLAVINGNYALQAGLKIADALAIEDASGDAAQTYANVIAVRNGEVESEKIQALVNAVKTEAVKQFMEEKYNGAVVAIY